MSLNLINHSVVDNNHHHQLLIFFPFLSFPFPDMNDYVFTVVFPGMNVAMNRKS